MNNPYQYHIIKSIFLFLFLMFSFSSNGQNGNLTIINNSGDSGNINRNSISDSQTDFIKSSYFEKIEAPKELINGKEYEPYYTRSNIIPLLFSGKTRTASIITNTRRYNNLTLQYDTFLDEVVYTDISRTINYRFPQIALNKDILTGFNLYFEDDSLIFKYFRLPECIEKNLKEGFYEAVYEGKNKYVIKHVSYAYERAGLSEYKYAPINYISDGDNFYEIENKKKLLRLFGKKSNEIKEFLHLSGIRIRKANKYQIISVLKFYDSLEASE